MEVNGELRNRYPDLTIIKPEHIEQLRDRNTIRLSMVPPDLVVEIVSPGNLQRDRDYIAKRNQYLDSAKRTLREREIPFYWIVDPQLKEIMVLTLIPSGYQEKIYQGSDRLQFQDIELNLTADEIISAG